MMSNLDKQLQDPDAPFINARLERVRAIVKEAQTGSMMTNWNYVFSFRECCDVVLDAAKKGAGIETIILLLNPGGSRSTLRGVVAKAGDKDKFIEDIKRRREEAANWERKTSLLGVDEAHKIDVMRARVRRCTNDAGRISWEVFLSNRENRMFVIERLKSARDLGTKADIALKELSFDLSEGSSKTGLLTIGTQVRTSNTNPLTALLLNLEAKQ